MVIEDLNYLIVELNPVEPNSVESRSTIRGGAYADVDVATYTSYDASLAAVSADAYGQFTWVDTDTNASLRHGTAFNFSKAYAHGNVYASDGHQDYWVRATQIEQQWW